MNFKYLLTYTAPSGNKGEVLSREIKSLQKLQTELFRLGFNGYIIKKERRL